jgi:hypothetical protein
MDMFDTDANRWRWDATIYLDRSSLSATLVKRSRL